MNTLKYKLFYRRHLPHYQPLGATLFVTFRLAGSISTEVMQSLRAASEQIDARLALIADDKERARQAYQEQLILFEKWDKTLDLAGHGPTWLRDEEIATLIMDSLHYRHKKVYTLETFTVMSNHVHVLFTPLPRGENDEYHALSAIMHSLKRHTALNANRILGREGAFWQSESYDHVVRDQDDLQRIVHYIMHNPVKAGLVKEWEDWPWSYCRYDLS